MPLEDLACVEVAPGAEVTDDVSPVGAILKELRTATALRRRELGRGLVADGKRWAQDPDERVTVINMSQLDGDISTFEMQLGEATVGALGDSCLMLALESLQLVWRKALRLPVNNCVAVCAEQNQVWTAVDIVPDATFSAWPSGGTSDDVALTSNDSVWVTDCLRGMDEGRSASCARVTGQTPQHLPGVVGNRHVRDSGGIGRHLHQPTTVGVSEESPSACVFEGAPGFRPGGQARLTTLLESVVPGFRIV